MTDTLAVVALDAADLRLAREWECSNVLLENHGDLLSFSHTLDVPATTEVWPTVATGLPPEEHGLVATGEQQEWTNPLLRVANRVTPYFLPQRLRTRLGRVFRDDASGTDMVMRRTDADHVFPEGAVYGWPGITDATHLLETWDWLERAKDGELDEREFTRRLWGAAGEELGWLASMAQVGFPVVGVHLHVLDAAGHAYATREDRLREFYERVDDLLGMVRARVDRMAILSDHGMEVGWIEEDDEPGEHSWRALFATTESGAIPESVYDVREWIETHRGTDTRMADGRTTVDATRDQLEALGYM